MNRFIVLGFDYLDVIYYCLVRYKMNKDHNEYVITVMNGELERILFGDHIIREREGSLELERSTDSVRQQLKESIARALADLLGLPLKIQQAI